MRAIEATVASSNTFSSHTVTTILTIFIADACTFVTKESHFTGATITFLFITGVYTILWTDLCASVTVETNSTTAVAVASYLITF